MRLHRFHAVQLLPVSIDKAWSFFSSPENLAVITPPELSFTVTSPDLPSRTYAGQIITYTVSPIAGIPLQWVTEITHLQEPFFFTDEQRSGPYALWHHQHRFREIPGGTEMTDEVHYVLPLGWLGTLAHRMVVRKKIEGIFRYREAKLKEIFGEWKTERA